MTDQTDRDRIIAASEANGWTVTPGFAAGLLLQKDGHPSVTVTFAGTRSAPVDMGTIKYLDGAIHVDSADLVIATLEAKVSND